MAIEELYSGHGWRVVLEAAKLPDGRERRLARIHRCDSVHILAFPTDSTILLLREYRAFYGTKLWMLPSGRADKEDDLAAAAQRELQEETGFRAGILRHYCSTNHTESLVMTNHIFLATNLQPAPLPQDPYELIEVHTLDLEEALDKVLSSPIVHTASAYALLKYLREHP